MELIQIMPRRLIALKSYTKKIYTFSPVHNFSFFKHFDTLQVDCDDYSYHYDAVIS